MGIILLLAFAALIAYAFWKRHINDSKINNLSADLNIISKSAEHSFLSFKGDKFYCSNFKNAEEPLLIKNNVFLASNSGLQLATINKKIPKLSKDEMDKAVNYAVAHGGRTCLATAAMSLNQSQMKEFDLSNSSTFLCAGKNENVFFSNDRMFNEYRLVDIDFTPKFSSTYTTKTKGRSGSALAGGLIAGPVGAVIGGSRKKKSTTTAHTSEIQSTAILTIIDSKSKEHKIALKTTSAYVDHLKTYFLHKFVSSNVQPEKEISVDSRNTTQKLRDLKGLLDDGILTQEEFEAKKKQLLNI